MDFNTAQRTALCRAGAVALPAAFPAYGQVSLRLTWNDGQIIFYVKIVQVVTSRRIVTWFVHLGDIRAIQVVDKKDGKSCPGSIMLPAEFKEHIAQKAKQLESEHKGKGIELEDRLYERAIVYVPEHAPVLHRLECGVTAAVSVEGHGFSSPGCCKHKYAEESHDGAGD
jgi:hypothetical protein